VARPLRVEFEGALYHVTARGNRRQAIFASEADREHFLGLLVQALGRFGVELHGFVLLSNHFHLLARTRRANLSRWMHWLMVSYTGWFNRRHGKVGHLFQGRYKALLVESGEYVLGLSRYMHLNPVRGKRLGLGDPRQRRHRLRTYRWSSYRGYAGLARQWEFVSEELVLEELGGRGPKERRLRYRQFVEEGLLRDISNPTEAARWQTVLGSEGFVQQIKDRMQPQREKRREVKALRQGTRGRPDPLELVRVVAREADLPLRRLLEGKAYRLQARSVAMWLVWHRCALSLREIGALFGGMDYAAVAQRIRRLEADRAMEKSLVKLLQKCQKV
jgi:REP-associated tyrosine transposase